MYVQSDTVPSSHYGLDTHVDSGVTNPDGAVAKIPHVLADLVWTLDRMLVGAVVDLFGWSFQLDLLNGDDGALRPVGQAITALYADTVGQNFLTAAVVIAGIWALFHAMVRRDYATATGRLGLSLILIVAALFVVRAPEQTIGGVSQWSNDFSTAVLSGLAGDGEEAGPDTVADSLHHQFIHQPWLVLNFGGLEVCTDLGGNRVEPDTTESKLCRPTDTPNAAGRGGYGQRFLKYRPGSDERDNEYRALAEGRLDVGSNTIPGIDIGPIDVTPGIGPRSTPGQFEPGYVVDDRDKAAVAIQQRGAGSERFVMALLIFAGTLGAVLLIGLLSLAVILAQVIALLIAAFAPVALVAGAIPGRGHAIFFEWAKGLVGALIAKAVLSLVLVVVLTVGDAVSGAVSDLGFMMAFGLTAAFYWVAFASRKRVFGALQTISAVSGVSSIGLPGIGRRARVRVGASGGRFRGGVGDGREPGETNANTDQSVSGRDTSQDTSEEHGHHQGPPVVRTRGRGTAGTAGAAFRNHSGEPVPRPRSDSVEGSEHGGQPPPRTQPGTTPTTVRLHARARATTKGREPVEVHSNSDHLRSAVPGRSQASAPITAHSAGHPHGQPDVEHGRDSGADHRWQPDSASALPSVVSRSSASGALTPNPSAVPTSVRPTPAPRCAAPRGGSAYRARPRGRPTCRTPLTGRSSYQSETRADPVAACWGQWWLERAISFATSRPKRPWLASLQSGPPRI